MKKAKRRKRQFCLSRRRISLYASFCAEAKKMNAARIEFAFRKGDKVVLKIIIWDVMRCVFILCENRGYYTISYDRHQRYAHPYTMTLAKYKQLNDRLS